MTGFSQRSGRRGYGHPYIVRREEMHVLGFIALLLAVWLVVAIVGAVVEGLFWLLVIGALLFVATAAFGWTKRKTGV